MGMIYYPCLGDQLFNNGFLSVMIDVLACSE
jgi:hypothetical protein